MIGQTLRGTRILTGILIVALLVGYALWQSREMIRGPVISVKAPGNGGTLSGPYAEITGNAENIAFINLNGRTIYTNSDGDFREAVLLPDGYSVIQISAKDRFGRTTTETLEVVSENNQTSNVAEAQSSNSRRN